MNLTTPFVIPRKELEQLGCHVKYSFKSNRRPQDKFGKKKSQFVDWLSLIHVRTLTII